MSGPKLEIVAHCTGCEWLRGENGNGMIYNGRRLMFYEPRCSHAHGPVVILAAVPDPLTPESCPLLSAARAAFLEEARKV